jgi:hypothetical protein
MRRRKGGKHFDTMAVLRDSGCAVCVGRSPVQWGLANMIVKDCAALGGRMFHDAPVRGVARGAGGGAVHDAPVRARFAFNGQCWWQGFTDSCWLWA